MGVYVNKDVNFNTGEEEFTFTSTDCKSTMKKVKCVLKEKNAYFLFVNGTGAYCFKDYVDKSEKGYPLVR